MLIKGNHLIIEPSDLYKENADLNIINRHKPDLYFVEVMSIPLVLALIGGGTREFTSLFLYTVINWFYVGGVDITKEIVWVCYKDDLDLIREAGIHRHIVNTNKLLEGIK